MNSQTAQVLEKIKDPVCGMTVDPAGASGEVEYEGQAYYFCSARCLEKFASSGEFVG